jgi:TPR repeat protein
MDDASTSQRVKSLSFEQTLEQYRSNALKTSDPQVLFDFAKYMIEASQQLEDVVTRESLQQEGMKLFKKLGTQTKPAFPDALFFLAESYGKGLYSLPVDHDKAFQSYLQASKQNHPAATYRVGVCYEMGAGTKKDPSRAMNFYRKAGALSDQLAMHKLGLVLLNGFLGQPKNAKEGVNWLKRAASSTGHPQALHDLAQCYEKDKCPAVLPDEAYALNLYQQAASMNYAPSQYRLGCCFEYGQLGCPINPVMSVEYYTKAADTGYAEAELALSGWFLTGAEGLIKQSDTEAYIWARKAADKKLAKAEYAVGHYSEKGIGARPDLDEAKRWYARATAQGHPKAAQRLHDLKKLGKNAPNSNPKKEQGECRIM